MAALNFRISLALVIVYASTATRGQVILSDFDNSVFYFASLPDVDGNVLEAARFQRIAINPPSNIDFVDYDPVEDYIYWFDREPGIERISRIHVDGTGQEELVTWNGGTFGVGGRATVDSINRKLYWTNTGSQTINSANLDGSAEVEVLQVNSPRYIKVLPETGYLYWTELPDSGGDEVIVRAKPDGTEKEQVVPVGRGEAFDVTNCLDGDYLTCTSTEEITYAVGDEICTETLDETTCAEDAVGECAFEVKIATRTHDGITYLGNETHVYGLRKDVLEGYPKTYGEEFPGLPDNMDAALYYPENGYTFFFKGNDYWKLKNQRIINGFPKSIQSLPGFPSLAAGIDAVFIYSGDNKIYFTVGDQYYRYDVGIGVNTMVYPRPMSDWNGVPSTIDAAGLSRGSYTYFFKGSDYYIYAQANNGVASGYPQNVGTMLLNCNKDQSP